MTSPPAQLPAQQLCAAGAPAQHRWTSPRAESLAAAPPGRVCHLPAWSTSRRTDAQNWQHSHISWHLTCRLFSSSHPALCVFMHAHVTESAVPASISNEARSATVLCCSLIMYRRLSSRLHTSFQLKEALTNRRRAVAGTDYLQLQPGRHSSAQIGDAIERSGYSPGEVLSIWM
jgi:hypothetical protein